MRRAILAALLALAPAAFAQSGSQTGDPQRGSAPTPSDANRAADTSQRGSRGTNAGGDERTGPPGAGVESGDANGMAGGRTDEGPRGGTGIREGGSRIQRDRARGKVNSQARRRNKKGSLDRPADSPPQRNEDPKPMGSGAPMVPVTEQPQPEGRNYVEGPQPGAAGGVASGTEGAPGGSSPSGVSGKGGQTQPDKKTTGDQPETPR
jgi:hypothetical protein